MKQLAIECVLLNSMVAFSHNHTPVCLAVKFTLMLPILYMQLHVKECPNVEEACNLGCGVWLPRALREQHASECSKRLISCSYCGFSIPMDALEVGVCSY